MKIKGTRSRLDRLSEKSSGRDELPKSSGRNKKADFVRKLKTSLKHTHTHTNAKNKNNKIKYIIY